MPGTYKNDKPFNNTGFDKIQLKADCTQGSVVNGNRQGILYSFPLSSHPVHKIYKEPGIKFFEKINKPVLSLIPFYLGNDYHRPIAFYVETISSICQLTKI